MYRIFRETLTDCDDESYVTYGILCDETGKLISDVTMNRARIEKFVDLINDNELDPVHLADVVEDFLAELQ